MAKKQSHNKIAAARLQAIKIMPYMSTAMYTLVLIQRPGLGTFGVTEDGRMLYDPAFADSFSDEEIGTVILHEALHLLSDHCGRAKAKGVFGQMLWNVAADCSINSDLKSAGAQFPSDDKGVDLCVHPDQFKLPPHQLSEWYYDELRKQVKEQQGKSQKQKSCGTGAGGEALPGEEPQQGEQQGKVSGKDVNKDKEPEGRSKEDLEKMRRETAQAIQAHAKQVGRGNMPAGLSRWADEILQPPKVDWRIQFKSRMRKAFSQKAGLVDFSYSRPSRRQFSNKKIVLPSMTMPTPTIGILIDTSGSMSQEYLGLGLGQIRHLLGVTQAHAYLAVCDTTVYDLKRIRSVKEVQASLKGGGGTDLRPAFEALETVNCDVIVAISDCDAYLPEDSPKAEVVWLRTGGHNKDPHFGRIIQMEVTQ